MGNARKWNEVLRHERESRNWTQAQIAQALHIDSKRVSEWEGGKTKPSYKYRAKLQKLFKMSAEDFGFLDQELNDGASDEDDLQEENPEVADIPHESSPTQPITRTNLDGHQPIQLFVPSSSPLVTIQIHRQAPVPLSPHLAKNDIIDSRMQKITSQGESSEMPQRSDGKFSRREIIGLVAGVPFLSLTHISHLLHDEELLSICAVNIPICWRLYMEGHFATVEHDLPGNLSQTSLLAQLPSPHQMWAASLASKAHQLACMLALQTQDFGLALMYVDQALDHAQTAGDYNLQVASLIRKALVYFYLVRVQHSAERRTLIQQTKLETYEKAAQHIDKTSPLLRGRVYMGLAEAHSCLGHEYEALHFLDRAYATFPMHPQADPNFAYTHFSFSRGHEGLLYLNLNQSRKAWEALAKLDKSLPEAVIPERVELSIRQAKVSVALGDLDQSLNYLSLARNSAVTLGSRLRYDETCDVYQQVQTKWPREKRVRKVAELFQAA